MFCAVYPRLDPDEETLVRFYGLLNLIPDKIKIEWGYGDGHDLDAQAERLEFVQRCETLGD